MKYLKYILIIFLLTAGIVYADSPNFWLLNANRIKPISNSWDVLLNVAAGDPAGTNGLMRYNSTTNKFRCYENGAWANCIGAGGSGNSAWTLAKGFIYNATTTDQVLIGATATTTTQKLEVIGGGYFSQNLNLATTTASQLLGTDVNKNLTSITLATGTAGNIFNVSTSTANTLTINCPNASASVSGCLQSADWTTFNNKQASGNYITALTGDVTASGPGSVAATLATVNSNVGTFGNNSGQWAQMTVNGKGLITAAANVIPTISTTTVGDVFNIATSSTNLFTLNLPTNLINNVSTTTAVNNVFSVSTSTRGTGMAMVLNVPQNIVLNVATGTAGNNFNISTSTLGTGNALVINLPNASASLNGQLISTDWTTFNNKVATSRQILTTAPITGGGDLSADRTIACNVASGSQAGCLASADWTTFNNKVGTQAWTLGLGFIRNATTTDQVLIGETATTTTATFELQGVAGANNLFSINSSTKVSLMTMSANGSVGIGTTTNQATLYIQGTSTLPSLDIFDVASSTGASYLHVTNSGNVGIGTTNPQRPLHVIGNTPLRLDRTGNGSYDFALTGSMAGSSLDLYVTPNQASGGFAFNPTNSGGSVITGLGIDRNGNVGIGTTAPTSLLQLSAGAPVLTFDAYSQAANVKRVRFISSVFTAGDLALQAMNDDGTVKSTNIEIQNGGNVGIGTSTPIATLSIQGTSTLPGVDLFDVSSSTNVSSTSTYFHITNNGMIGIGTSTPGYRLTFQSGATQPTEGINFGDVTANLYRNAAGQIKTDGVLNVNSTSLFTGNATFSGSIFANGGVIRNNTAASTLQLGGNLANTAGQSVSLYNSGNSMGWTSGSGGNANIGATYNPASGSGSYFSLNVGGTINQLTNSSGITRGILVLPTLTLAADYRAIETGSYVDNIISLNPANIYGTLLNQYIISTSSSQTVKAASLLTLTGAPAASSSNITITSSTALSIMASTTVVNSGVVTNAISLYVQKPSSATNNYSAIFNAGVGVGTDTPLSTAAFSTNGTVYMQGLTTSAGTQSGIVCLDAAQQLINESVACLASARRFKTNIQPLVVDLNELMKYQPVQFKWNKKFNAGFENNPNYNGTQFSLVADDVQKIDPHMVSVEVSGKDKGKVHGLADLNHWVAKFVGWLQDIEKQIETIFTRLNNQDTRMDKMQQQLDRQQIEIDGLKRSMKLLFKERK